MVFERCLVLTLLGEYGVRDLETLSLALYYIARDLFEWERAGGVVWSSEVYALLDELSEQGILRVEPSGRIELLKSEAGCPDYVMREVLASLRKMPKRLDELKDLTAAEL